MATPDYRTNRDLFSNYYLDERLPETEAWSAADEAARSAYETFRDLYREAGSPGRDESEAVGVSRADDFRLRRDLLTPAFEALGWASAVGRPIDGGRPRSDSGESLCPDYTLFGSEQAREDALRRRCDGESFHADALAVADAERWDRSLDGGNAVEGSRLHAYLDATAVDRAVLTNGRTWRLYYRPAGRRLDAYYEIDLPELLATGDPEAFKYFYLFFGRNAPVERVHRGSEAVAESLGDDLRENAAEALSVLAQGFAESVREADGAGGLGRDDLDAIYAASLTYLYRLVFVLYAESDGRDLLDADDEVYRRRYSPSALARRVAGDAGGPVPESASDFDSAADSRSRRTALAERLDELFALLDEGSRARGVPPDDLHVLAYDGGLFRTDPDAGGTAAFLDAHAVGDAALARVLELLTRRETDRGDRAVVDYSSLDVRRLGSVYEDLLEYDLEVADGDDREAPDPPVATVREDADSAPDSDPDPGEVYLTTDGDERKATGSYYTPEFVVEYAVERALDPLLDEIRADLDPDSTDYAERFAERAFDLAVLDPAMGSGHFLVGTVEYLARAVVEARRTQAERAGRGTVEAERGLDWARRQVARRCVYGVDSDGMAVELAKVSLWLRTAVADRPLVSLDRHLERGDALAGIDADGLPGGSDGPPSGSDGPARESNGPAREETEARFDAVVGNPPYVRSRNLPEDRRERYREAFSTARGAYDLYVPFAELAADLGRRASLVVPNKWTTTDYGRALRDRLLDDGLREVVDASNLDVFPDASVYPVVVTFGDAPRRGASPREGESASRADSPDPDIDSSGTADADESSGTADCAESSDTDERDADERGIRVATPETDSDPVADSDAERPRLADAPATTVPRSLVDRLGGRVIPLDLTPEFADIAEGVLDRCDRLGDHVTLTEGVHTGNVRERLVVESGGDGRCDGGTGNGRDAEPDPESDPTCRRLVDGTSVGRYRLDWDGRWLRYDESLVGPGEYADFRTPDCFETEKLLVADISDRPVAVHDDADHYALNTLYAVRSRPESSLSLRYLLGVFNSEFVATYYRQVYGGTHVRGGYLRFKPMFVERIPVPDPDAAPVGPDEVADVAERAGVATEDVPGDPESAVAALTERVRAARDRRGELDLDIADRLGPPAADPAGATLGELGVPAAGVGDSVLAETAADRDGLRVGEVRVEEVTDDRSGGLVLSATARYKPSDGERSDGAWNDDDGPGGHGERSDAVTATATDPWGYVETDPVPAVRFPDLDATERTLVEAFVPRAVAEGGGFAGFRENATKTNSLLDRLRALTLPDAGSAADAVARHREVRRKAETLDERIAALDAAIDGVVYRLYGLDEGEVETIE